MPIVSRTPRALLPRLVLAITSAAILLAGLAPTAQAQRRARRRTAARVSALPELLRGSKASVQKMWDFAQGHHMPFYLTPTNLNTAIAQGRLVPLAGDSTYALTRGVGYSYATREAKQFVLAFAPQYLAACGTPLTVTSAARPTSRQPRNANPFSVHPTGIAVDLRRPPAGPCLTWVRRALAELEEKGIVEATEERHPVHLHVAVLTEPGRAIVLPPLAAGPIARASSPVPPSGGAVATSSPGDVASPSRTAAGARSYRVREGDTLWEVAQRTGVSVQALARANNRSPRAVLRPGVTLRLPVSASR